MRIDLTDQYDAKYTAYIEAFRSQVELVATEILLTHFLDEKGFVKMPKEHPEQAPSVTAWNFSKKLVGYFLDKEELVSAGDGAVVPSATTRARLTQKEEIGARNRPHLGELFDFLARFRDIAGHVASGKDALKVLDAQYGMRTSMKFWEYLQIEMPAKRPCNVLMGRALIAKLAETPNARVFEGGAGLGVVLRETLANPGFDAVEKNLARYEYTDIAPLLLELGKQRVKSLAPADVFQRIQFQRVDLDEMSSRPQPAAYDFIALEHVLYDVRDLDATLKTFHSMLKPGGQLAFTMSFRLRPALFFPNEIFQSMLHTYNKAKLDPPRRQNVGYLTLKEWELSLEAAGFTDWDTYPAPEDHTKWPFGGIVARRS